MVLRRGGVIRSMSNWGVFSLPQAISRYQLRHHNGHYFAMRFDASVSTQEAVRSTLQLDPRVIRSSSVKLGDGKLETLSRMGKIDWDQY